MVLDDDRCRQCENMHDDDAFLHYCPAPMSALDWNDLRTFAEVARRGSLAAAARTLGVHSTTISRRITAAEEALGSPLFLRAGKGLVLASAGARVLAALDPLVDAVDEVARRASRREDAPIRIAVTENGARLIAAFAVPRLAAQSPALQVELLAGNDVVDLAKGQADLAIRTIEPTSSDLVRKRLGASHYGLYATTTYLANAPPISKGLAGHTIVVPGGELARSPAAAFFAEHCAKASIALRCSSLIALAIAAEAGVGLVALPTNLAVFHAGLTLVQHIDEIAPHPVWLVMHGDARRDPRVTLAGNIVSEVISKQLADAAPRGAGPRTNRKA